MKVGKISSFFDKTKNPYKRWGIFNKIHIGDEPKNSGVRYSYIKISKGQDVFFFGGYDDEGNVKLVDLKNAVSAGHKECSRLRKKLGNEYTHINIVTSTRTIE